MTQPSGPLGPDDPTRDAPWTAPPAGAGAGPGAAPGAGPPPPSPWSAAPGPPGPPTSVSPWGGHPAGPPPERGRRSPLRILGRAALVLVVLGALAGTTAWGLVNRSSAQQWRDRGLAADARLEESLTRVEATSVEVEDARQRLRDLAAEKAGETDRNRILSEIVAQAPEVTAALRDCQQETTTLTNDVIEAFGDPATDVAALERRIGEVNRICADALDASTALEDSIDELGL